MKYGDPIRVEFRSDKTCATTRVHSALAHGGTFVAYVPVGKSLRQVAHDVAEWDDQKRCELGDSSLPDCCPWDRCLVVRDDGTLAAPPARYVTAAQRDEAARPR